MADDLDMPAFTPTARSKVRRRPQRAHYDEATVFAILDAGVLAHVAYASEGQPFVIPTCYWRVGRKLYWHGSAASRMIRAQRGGLPVCVTVSHLDGLVVARSGFVHSANYRSVVAFGRAKLTPPEGIGEALNAFIDRLYPGRPAGLRPALETELKQSSVIEMEIEEAAAKVRAAGVAHLPEDEDWTGAWSGVIPIRQVVGEPMADAVQSAGRAPDANLSAYRAGVELGEVLTEAAHASR